MGIRTGIGILIGIMPPILYFMHDGFRDFINETIDSLIVGIQNAV